MENDLDGALERFYQTALRARDAARQGGVAYERSRVRKRLLDSIRRLAFPAKDVPSGSEIIVLRSELLAAVDKICPEKRG